MLAVTIEWIVNDGHQDAFDQASHELHDEVVQFPGFLSIEKFAATATPGKMVSISYWQDQLSVAAWRRDSAHIAAIKRGNEEWLKWYRISILELRRQYDFDIARGPGPDAVRHLFPAAANQTAERIAARVSRIVELSETVKQFELEPVDTERKFALKPGSHIDLFLPTGDVRQYSLINAHENSGRLEIAVRRIKDGRGGSIYMHDVLRQGDQISLGLPRDHFVFETQAPHTILIAGGIGVTPIYSMMNFAVQHGLSHELHFANRSRADAPFIDQLSAKPGAHLHFSDEQHCRLDIGSIVANAPAGSHFYCCGPQSMLTDFLQATAHLPAETVHAEYFVPPKGAPFRRAFTVEAAKSKKIVKVEPYERIADVLIANGIDVPTSCRQGICGTCLTPVLSGRPDHRDSVLSSEQKAAGKMMTLCCSGALGEGLVLDI